MGMLDMEDLPTWYLPSLKSLTVRRGSLQCLSQVDGAFSCIRITYLEIHGPRSVWSIVERLPLLEALTTSVKLDLTIAPTSASVQSLSAPHRNLATITLVPHEFADYDTVQFLMSSLSLVRLQLLQALHNIQIVGTKGSMQSLPNIRRVSDQLFRVGINLEEVSAPFQ